MSHRRLATLLVAAALASAVAFAQAAEPAKPMDDLSGRALNEYGVVDGFASCADAPCFSGLSPGVDLMTWERESDKDRVIVVLEKADDVPVRHVLQSIPMPRIAVSEEITLDGCKLDGEPDYRTIAIGLALPGSDFLTHIRYAWCLNAQHRLEPVIDLGTLTCSNPRTIDSQ